MTRRIQYKDTLVQEGSQMYGLLTSGKPEDKKKAEALYKECNAKFLKDWPEDKHHLLNWKVGNERLPLAEGQSRMDS